MSKHIANGVYPPPADLPKKNVSLASPQHKEQDRRKKGTQAKYLSKDSTMCL